MAKITPNRFPTKLPGEVLDYAVDWSAALAGEAITGDPVVTASGGLTADRVAVDGADVVFWLGGGTPGYGRVSCEITTSGGRTFEASIPILILAP